MPPRLDFDYTAVQYKAVLANYIKGAKLPIYNDAYNDKCAVPEIRRVEVLNPKKVLRFTFADGTQVKTIRRDEDSFDFEFAFYIAYAKLLWGKYLTPEGIWQKACELKGQKLYVKLVEKAIRRFNRENGNNERRKT